MDEKKSVLVSEPLSCLYMVHLGDKFTVSNYKSKSASVIIQECLRYLSEKVKGFSSSTYSRNKLRYYRKRDDEDHFSLMFDDVHNSVLKELLVNSGFRVHVLGPQYCFVRIRPIPPFITQDDLDKKLKEVFPNFSVTGSFSTDRAGVPFAVVLRMPRDHKQDVLSWKSYNGDSKHDKLADFNYEEQIPPDGLYCKNCFKRGHTTKSCVHIRACELCGGPFDHSTRPCDALVGCLFCQSKDHTAMRCPLARWPWVPFNSKNLSRPIFKSSSSRPASAWPLSPASVESDVLSLKQSISNLQISIKEAQETPPAWVNAIKKSIHDSVKAELVQDFGHQITAMTSQLKTDVAAIHQHHIGMQYIVHSLLDCLHQSSLVRSDASLAVNLAGLIEHKYSRELTSALIPSQYVPVPSSIEGPVTSPAPTVPSSAASTPAVVPAQSAPPITSLLPSSNQPLLGKRKNQAGSLTEHDEQLSDQQSKIQRSGPSALKLGPSSSSGRDPGPDRTRNSRSDNLYADFGLRASDAIGPDSFVRREAPLSGSSSADVVPMCTSPTEPSGSASQASRSHEDA